ncbi:TlpA family protein disulfide reductase [Noviherbaspirillum cavernae]|nr:hypothetical protein [Noviherbaspirillum cavernae]
MARKLCHTGIGFLLMLCALTAHAAQAIQAFEADSMARLVESRKGQPFVLIVWSLDCTYCQQSLKTLAEEKRKRKNLHVVTLATDALDDPQAAALMKKKLAAVGMRGNAWAFGAAPPEQLRYAIDPKWHGEIPRTYWFNARGESVAHSGVVTAATIEKLMAR